MIPKTKRKLTPAMFAKAREKEARAMQSIEEAGTENPTELNADRRWFIGDLGESALADWLTESGKWFDYRWSTQHKSQDVEFIVASNINGNWGLEVKTASKIWHRKFMMPASQRVGFDVAFGVRLDIENENDAWGEIMGMYTRAKVMALDVDIIPPNKVKTRWGYYKDMIQPAELLTRLQ